MEAIEPVIGVLFFGGMVAVIVWAIVEHSRERARKRRYFERLVVAAGRRRTSTP